MADLSAFELEELARTYENASPTDILASALERHDSVAISFSGAEDVVLIDMAIKIRSDIRVFSLDTGRLHSETYRFFDKVRDHYRVDIEVQFPDSAAVEQMIVCKGFHSFYADDHKECCAIRKVGPLRRKLATLDAWITGQREDQNAGTRHGLPAIQYDAAFATPEHALFKYNPLTHWSSAKVWEYIRRHSVPYNPLHERGYISIGCEPCTRAVLPNQPERDGRWWWEESTLKECGLHALNVASR